jgi:1,4-dihydroxy-2-naphthoate polyprenyltransferase
MDRSKLLAGTIRLLLFRPKHLSSRIFGNDDDPCRRRTILSSGIIVTTLVAKFVGFYGWRVRAGQCTSVTHLWIHHPPECNKMKSSSTKTRRPPPPLPGTKVHHNNDEDDHHRREPRPSALAIWIVAARPHTLTASLSPLIVAFALTRPPALYFCLWLLFCVTVQIGTNLHNDYADFVLGADTADNRRVGSGMARATARGWWTPRQTCVASTAALSITCVSGVTLVAAAGLWRDPLMWGIVLSSLYNAFAYTGGPYPLGYLGLLPHPRWSIAYAGLGEVFVFAYFGLAATLTLPYILYMEEIEDGKRQVPDSSSSMDYYYWTGQWICAAQMGLLAINIIVVNNLRDRLTDVHAGKRTTAVRFGRRFCEVEYLLCNVLAFGLVLAHAALTTRSGGEGVSSSLPPPLRQRRLLPLFSIVPALRETLCVLRKEGPDLNVHVGGAAKVQLLFALLVALGEAADR